MIKAYVFLALALGACAVTPSTPPIEPAALPVASMPPEQPRLLTPVEIVGDYAGKQMKLVIDGQTVFEGRGQLMRPEQRWIFQVQPGNAPADLALELENCAVYRGQISRTGGLQAVMIKGCVVALIGG